MSPSNTYPVGNSGHGDAPSRSDAELAALDVTELIRVGLPEPGPARRTMFGDGTVAAALQVGELGIDPRAVTVLAERVKAAGARAAAAIPEPLPGERGAALARGWLEAAAGVQTRERVDAAPALDDVLARWLRAAAAVLAVRLSATRRATP